MDFSQIRRDFPTMRNDQGVYLDSACQSLRPDSVIDAIREYYERCPACGGRSVHHLSNEVSVRVDETRETLCSFFNGEDPDHFVFTRNTTDGINTVAGGFGLKKGDVVVTTDSEHNSNYVPWLNLRDSVGIVIRRSVSGTEGIFDIESFKEQMGKDVKLVSVCHVSNVTGVEVPVKDVADIAHEYGAKVLVDGCAAAPHIKVDIRDSGADFYAFSMHKLLGPSGFGVLYGRPGILEELGMRSFGGGTVGMVTYDSATFAPVPDRFEAGLQDYAGVFGTKAAIDYISKIGMDEVERHDSELVKYMMDSVEDVRGLSVVGPSDPSKRRSIFSFNIAGLLSHDIAMMLDSIDGIMIRSGMHCAHSFFDGRGIDGSARASVYLYNDKSDIDRFSAALRKVAETFSS
ncbi:Selenocysteine lyase [Thermoplasmatales archaeon BRNA1]|nr:Selenocysteine lyase [Thermoplasmatales archaeon BRNA1]